MIQDLKLEEQKLDNDYKSWHHYYNYQLISFYATRLSKQCWRLEVPFPYSLNFGSLLTDKFVLTDTSNRATITRNITDTHWIEDTYYQIARYIYNNDINEQEMIQYLIDNNRSKKKPFAMQWLVGAIESSTKEELNNCVQKIRGIQWSEDNW